RCLLILNKPLRFKLEVEFPIPNNCNTSEQSAWPPKNPKTCERVRFEGSTISGIVIFASAVRFPVKLAQEGNSCARLIGGRPVGEAAETVRVAVTIAVIVSTPLSVVVVAVALAGSVGAGPFTVTVVSISFVTVTTTIL